jgi:hypothetical protein
MLGARHKIMLMLAVRQARRELEASNTSRMTEAVRKEEGGKQS